jgi:hypothetical protein
MVDESVILPADPKSGTDHDFPREKVILPDATQSWACDKPRPFQGFAATLDTLSRLPQGI